jgi:ribosomal protein S6
MDKRSFARVADKKVKDGFYVNFIFAAEPALAAKIERLFELDDDVFRVLITHAAPVPVPAQ